MAQNRYQPRKSVFSSDTHPLQHPSASTEPPQETLKSKSKGKGANTNPRVLEADLKVKASFYGDSVTLGRLREAFQRTQVDEGYESFSDFIVQAALEKTQRLEKKYNGGQPYPGIKRLSPGRPLSS